MLRRRPSPLLCYLLAFSQAFWVFGCSDSISGSGSGASSTLAGVLAQRDLGSVVFEIYRDSIAAEPAGPERDARLAALDAREVEFVQAVNDIVNVNTLQGVSQTTDALFALVDDDTLPVLAEHVARTLEELLADPQAQDGVLELLNGSSRGSLPVEELVGLLGRMVNYPETEQLWQAIARLIRENDGVDDQGFPNHEPRLTSDLLALASDSLSQAAGPSQPGSAISAALDEVLETLTSEATIRGTFDFGAPEWVAELDARGLPRVASDPATGRLFAPFVDVDGDGLADTDAAGDPVDAQGNAIDLPTFGDPSDPARDAAGRALTSTGQLVYVYVDAKRTILALLMQLSGELLSRDLHHKGRVVLEAGFGAQRPDQTYERTNPVLELGWGGLSLLEEDVAISMLRASAEQVRSDPATAEQVFVALSRGLEAMRQAGQRSTFSSTRFSDPRTVQLFDDLLPLADDLFEQPTTGQVSTARQLMDTLAELKTKAPNFPAQMAPLLKFVSVEREATPDADRNDIDELRSWPVDHTQPAWLPGGADNRSALHQLLDLLQRADNCTFFGQNLAVLILDVMADQSPATVSNLVSFLTALPGWAPNLFCSGISQDLASLDALARSGALDALLPLAKDFKDRGETELLVRLLVRLQADYDQTIRPIEPDVALLLESGAVESFLEVIDLSRTITDPVTGETVADISARAIETLVDDDGAVLGPRGQQVTSRMHLLLRPLQELDRRIGAAGLDAELDALSTGLFEVFLERVTVGGVEQLRNGSLIPLAERSLDIMSRHLPADDAVRAQEVAQAQADLLDAGSSRGFAAVVDVLRVIGTSPTKGTIDRSLVNMLTPNRVVADDIFGAVARIAVLGLQAPPSATALRKMAPFLSRVVDPANPLVPDSLRAFERLLTADQGKTILNILRAALNPGPGQQDPPAVVLIHVIQAVEDARSAQGGGFDRAALQSGVRSMVDFIRDDQSGLEWIFDLIRSRQVR